MDHRSYLGYRWRCYGWTKLKSSSHYRIFSKGISCIKNSKVQIGQRIVYLYRMADHQVIAIRALDRCNVQLDQLFQRIDDIDPHYLSEKLDENTWSVIQILNHVLQGEQLALSYMQYKKEQGAVLEKESWKARWRFHLTMIALSLPLKFKAPGKLNSPSNQESLEEVKANFLAARVALRAFMDEQDPSFFRMASCKHPRIGRITLTRMIRFFHKHVQHHEKQILRRLITLSKME